VYAAGAIAGAGIRPVGGGGAGVGAGVGVATAGTTTLWVMVFVAPVIDERISTYSVWVPELRDPTIQSNVKPELFQRALP
jgi:hypothetical protein